MLNLSTENKNLCFEDSTLKPLSVFLYYWKEDKEDFIDSGHWQYYTTIDEAIILESAEIVEGVLESDTFELGSFVVPSIKLQWENNGVSYKDMLAIPVQQIGDEYIAYFDGFVSNEEISENGQSVNVEIQSTLSQRLDFNILYSLLDGIPVTFETLITDVLGLAAQISIKNNLSKKFLNANTIIKINENTLPKTLTVSELLKMSGEFLGAHIVVKEKRVVNIEDMKTYEPTGYPFLEFIRLSNVDEDLEYNSNVLPKGYTLLPYIHFSGQQYIDTGVVPNENTNAQYTIEIDEMKNYGPHILSAQNFWFPYFEKFNSNNNQVEIGKTFLSWYRFGSQNGNFEVGNAFEKKNISAFFDDKVTLNGEIFEANKGSETTTSTLYLGAYGGDPSNEQYTFIGKIFSCKIFDGYDLIRNFLPCIRENDNKIGMYDSINNNFYENNGLGDFTAPNPIEKYTLPYHISLYHDKIDRVKFDGINVITQTGEQLQYTKYWSMVEGAKYYQIKDNIFFEGLSTESADKCWEAIDPVGNYLKTQNLYHAELQSVYPPFIEPGDCLITKYTNNKIILPDEYLLLKSANISEIDTGIIPNSDNIELSIEFEPLKKEQGYLIYSDGREQWYNTLNLFITEKGSIIGHIGYYGGSIQIVTFETVPLFPNQKALFNLKIKNDTWEYTGTIKDNGNRFFGGILSTHTPLIFSAKKFYHFSYSQDGIMLCDYYPCMRKSDGAIGVYDIIRNIFTVSPHSIEYESGDIVIPVLSSNSSGIHSMIADISCKATNTNVK